MVLLSFSVFFLAIVFVGHVCSDWSWLTSTVTISISQGETASSSGPGHLIITTLAMSLNIHTLPEALVLEICGYFNLFSLVSVSEV